jgi:hypothetical protein
MRDRIWVWRGRANPRMKPTGLSHAEFEVDFVIPVGTALGIYTWSEPFAEMKKPPCQGGFSFVTALLDYGSLEKTFTESLYSQNFPFSNQSLTGF